MSNKSAYKVRVKSIDISAAQDGSRVQYYPQVLSMVHKSTGWWLWKEETKVEVWNYFYHSKDKQLPVSLLNQKTFVLEITDGIFTIGENSTSKIGLNDQIVCFNDIEIAIAFAKKYSSEMDAKLEKYTKQRYANIGAAVASETTEGVKIHEIDQ